MPRNIPPTIVIGTSAKNHSVFLLYKAFPYIADKLLYNLILLYLLYSIIIFLFNRVFNNQNGYIVCYCTIYQHLYGITTGSHFITVYTNEP